MKIRKVVQRRLRHEGRGVNVAGDVNAAISANVNEPGPTRTHVSTRSRVVQRSGSKKSDSREGGEQSREP